VRTAGALAETLFLLALALFLLAFFAKSALASEETPLGMVKEVSAQSC
jgi:hypothetical protein